MPLAVVRDPGIQELGERAAVAGAAWQFIQGTVQNMDSMKVISQIHTYVRTYVLRCHFQAQSRTTCQCI